MNISLAGIETLGARSPSPAWYRGPLSRNPCIGKALGSVMIDSVDHILDWELRSLGIGIGYRICGCGIG